MRPLFCNFKKMLCSFLLILSVNAHADLKDISRIYHSTPTLSSFEICHSGGCADSNTTSLNAQEWRKVSIIFAQKAQNAADERAQIANAIGQLEILVGDKIGTATDRAGTFDNSHYQGQMDCNDESINSTTYMRLLKQAGFMPLHEIEDTRTRSFFFNGWPHSTAVIHEVATGERFAIDSWFYDNGHAATIVQFSQWKSGYLPADSPIGKPHSIQAASPQH
jgi:hypothetical protein